MVKHYTVQTSNAFAALGDDSDSEDVILPLAPETQKAPTAAAAQQPASPAKPRREPVGLANQPTREGGAAPREGGAPREGAPTGGERRGPRREGGERQGPRKEGGERQGPRREGESRPRREPRITGEEGVITAESERRPPRPVGRGPRVVREGKREFDRVSGTGRPYEIKREGGGAFNWGKPGETEGWGEAEAEQVGGEQAPESPKAAEPLEAGEQAAAEQQPAQPKTFTYAQYKRQMEEKLGAGEDDSAARAAELEVERQKAIKEGYTLYTKETKGGEHEDELDRREDRKEKGGVKTLSLAEVAEKSGVALNYGGARRGGPRGEGRGGRREGAPEQGERRRGGGEGGRRGGSGSRGEQKSGGQQQQQQQQQQGGSKEINLVDNQAFPTLQAH